MRFGGALQKEILAVDSVLPVGDKRPKFFKKELTEIGPRGFGRFLAVCRQNRALFPAAVVAGVYLNRSTAAMKMYLQLSRADMKSVLYYLAATGHWTGVKALLGPLAKENVALSAVQLLIFAIFRSGKNTAAKFVAQQLLMAIDPVTGKPLCYCVRYVMEQAIKYGYAKELRAILPEKSVRFGVKEVLKFCDSTRLFRSLLTTYLVDMSRVRVPCSCGCRKLVPVVNALMYHYIQRSNGLAKSRHASCLTLAIQSGLAPDEVVGCKRITTCRPHQLRSTPMLMAVTHSNLRVAKFLYRTGVTSNRELHDLHEYLCDPVCNNNDGGSAAVQAIRPWVSEVATTPRRLEELCGQAVSRSIGWRPDRLVAIKRLDLAAHVKAQVLFSPAAEEFHRVHDIPDAIKTRLVVYAED